MKKQQERFKFIHDTVHGTIRADAFHLDILESPELQRLSGIRQLGLSYLVFPGANHTRLEHSLGTCHAATEMCRALGLADDERNTVAAAAMLHDVGHGPYSHTLESLFHRALGIEHMELTKRIILGDYDVIPDFHAGATVARQEIPDILERHGLDPREVAALVAPDDVEPNEFWPISGGKSSGNYRSDIIHSAIDADQIDYLLRDSHYTGVAYGTVDFDRLLQTMALDRGSIVVHEKGTSAVESILVARALMYSSVYFHKTVRIAELMLERAVERALAEDAQGTKPEEVQRMNDGELCKWLSSSGKFGADMVLSLKYRSLFKRAYSTSLDELSDAQKESLAEYADHQKRRRAEREIARRAGVPDGYVILDLPLPELLLSEPRISKVDIRIMTADAKVRTFDSQSTLSGALKIRNTVKWVAMVSTHKKYRERVKKAAKQVLFG